MARDILQGNSLLATPIKQTGLFGIYDMVATRWKNRVGGLLFADLYCGSGENKIPGQIIPGSPITLLESLAKAARTGQTPHSRWVVLFNDIAPGRASELLPEQVMAWQVKNGFAPDRNCLHCKAKDGSDFDIKLLYREGDAESALSEIQKQLSGMVGWRTTITIDPNGPKDVPWEMTKSLWETFRNIELIFHVAATPLKRVSAARKTLGDSFFCPMPDHIDGLINTFKNSGGWVREPVGADQWTLLYLTRHEPHSGWEKQGFYKLTPDSGQHLIKFLSTTKKERMAV